MSIVTLGSSGSALIMTAIALGPVGVLTFAPFALVTVGAALLGGYDIDKALGREILSLYSQQVKELKLAQLTEIKTADERSALNADLKNEFNSTHANDNINDAKSKPTPPITFGRK